MSRASSAHLQEDKVVHMQHMVLSLSMRVPGDLSVHSLVENSSVCTWGSKHLEEDSILWINNNQCIKLVINMKGTVTLRCVIPVVCVTNEREESVVNQHKLFRKMLYSNNETTCFGL